MRYKTSRFLLTVALLPAAVYAAAPPAKTPVKPATHKAAMADHATMGVVKSVNGTALTISRAGKDVSDMSFVLNPSTKRDGKIEVGAPVSVRYREDGATHVATAISAQHSSGSQQSSTAQHSKPQSSGAPLPSGKHR